MNKREALAQVPLFASLSPKHVERLAKQTLDYRYEPGRTFIKQGEDGETLFMLLEGRARIVRAEMASAGRIGCVRGRQRRADQAALFLASDDAGSITGADLIVDGGETII